MPYTVSGSQFDSAGSPPRTYAPPRAVCEGEASHRRQGVPPFPPPILCSTACVVYWLLSHAAWASHASRL